MKNAIIASEANTGLIIDRFNKFLKRISHGPIEVLSVWGKPKKREKWDGFPQNHCLTVCPKVGKHVGKKGVHSLISVQPQSEEDIMNLHFGSWSCLNENYPNGIEGRLFNSFQIEKGDKIFFKNEAVIVISKRNDSITKKIRSLMFRSAVL